MARKPLDPSAKPATRLAQLGRGPALAGRFVNPPVVRASTILFDSTEELVSGKAPYTYGRRGTPTLRSLEDALTDLEGAAGTVLCPSGLSALATTFSAFAVAGDHILYPDTGYSPGHHFIATELSRYGVSATLYDPTIGAGIAALIQPNTKLIHVESPGSVTMEMQDIPAIAAAAHARGALVTADNTWATPLYCKPLALGADVSLMSATKYIGGHADLMMGTIAANAAAWPRLKAYHGSAGLTAGPDEIFLALRGLRTLSVRLDRHHENALAVAAWLAERPEVARILLPSLPSDPGHALWRRDMTGGSGLFSFVLNSWSEAESHAFLDALTLFGLGYSWGGFESLALPAGRGLKRTTTPPPTEGPLIRLHIGLEDPADLIADLAQALAAVRP